VRIRAAKAKGIDPGEFAGSDRLSHAGEPQIEPGERNIRIGHIAIKRAGQNAVLQRQRRLQQPGNPGGRLQMADIGLDRADRQAFGAR
jgi:hypothetical protein